MSPDCTVYAFVVAPTIAVQPVAPVELDERHHWYVNDVGPPDHDPVEHVSVFPTFGVPDPTGGAVFAIVPVALDTAAVGSESTDADPDAFVAVTVAINVAPASPDGTR